LEERRRRLVETVAQLPGMGGGAILRRAAELAEGDREAVDRVLATLLWYYRDLAVWQLTRDEGRLRNRDLAAHLRGREMSAAGLLASVAAVVEARRQLRAYAAPRLVMEVLLLRLAEVVPIHGATGGGGAL
ncbi:MAG: hypothetical protein H5T97_14185, partial [Firmicutes bacterium]|nr:hypothetical protein [Bacillota bacterium]